MSLSHLIKHIYNSATDEVIRRGKKIHASGSVETMDHNALLSSISFRIKDDMYNTWYKVYIQNYADAKAMTLRCTCPYNLSDVCRHKAAALLQLQDLADRNALKGQETAYSQKHTLIKIRNIDLKMIRLIAGQENYEKAEQMLRSNKANIIKAIDEKVEAEVVYDSETQQVVLRKNEERFFDTSCTCRHTGHALCEHKTMVFLQLLNSFGANYFDSIKNIDRDKEKLLGLYGYSLSDDLTGKFEFAMKEGKPFLRVLDPTIKRVAAGAVPARPVLEPVFEHVPQELPAAPDVKRLGLVFCAGIENYPFFSIEAVQGDAAENSETYTGKVEKLDLAR